MPALNVTVLPPSGNVTSWAEKSAASPRTTRRPLAKGKAIPCARPVAVRERMAVRLLDRRADRRAHVREEQGRLDVPREVPEVGVLRNKVVDEA